MLSNLRLFLVLGFNLSVCYEFINRSLKLDTLLVLLLALLGDPGGRGEEGLLHGLIHLILLLVGALESVSGEDRLGFSL